MQRARCRPGFAVRGVNWVGPTALPPFSQVQTLAEAPVYLLMNADVRGRQTSLPVALYETGRQWAPARAHRLDDCAGSSEGKCSGAVRGGGLHEVAHVPSVAPFHPPSCLPTRAEVHLENGQRGTRFVRASYSVEVRALGGLGETGSVRPWHGSMLWVGDTVACGVCRESLLCRDGPVPMPRARRLQTSEAERVAVAQVHQLLPGSQSASAAEGAPLACPAGARVLECCVCVWWWWGRGGGGSRGKARHGIRVGRRLGLTTVA